MAIEGIANPTKAYQGSAPRMDAAVSGESPVRISERQAAQVREEAPANAADPLEQVQTDRRMPDVKRSMADPGGRTESAGDGTQSSGTEAMRKAVDEINRHIKNSEVVFGIHDKTNRVTIKIVDRDSHKVVREFPPEQTLDMIAKVWELAGIMVDEKR